MKFVMFERVDVNGVKQEVPVIFPEILIHIDVKRALMSTHPELKRVVSAGFVSLREVEVESKAKSGTLNLGPRMQDRTVMEAWDFQHGMVF